LTYIEFLQVEEGGSGRPNRVSFQEISLQRPKTGEEGAYEMNDDGEIGEGNLGMTTEEDLKRFVIQSNHVDCLMEYIAQTNQYRKVNTKYP
jgi:hypothetical protein